MYERPNGIEYFLRMARLVGTRATCRRRKVGCVLVNDRKHVLATGYNGNAVGVRHCLDYPCLGATYPSGQGLEFCEAIHAEQNALLQCRDVHTIATVYCTTAPCMTCTKLLMNTSAQRIMFIDDYPQSEAARKLWMGSGHARSWTQYEGKEPL